MSAEIVEGPAGLYVITGDPGVGYDVHPVGPPIASYERKFVARREVRSGGVNAAHECLDPQCVVCHPEDA